MTVHGVSCARRREPKKAAWLAATAGLVSARRGLVLTCKPSWLANAQHLSRRWSPQYLVLKSGWSLLRQNQLAETRGAQLVRLAVVHDADVTVSLQQSVAAQHALARFRRFVRPAGSGPDRSRRCDRRRFRTAGQRGSRTAQAERGRASGIGHSSLPLLDSMDEF